MVELNPAQQRLLEILGAKGNERPVFDETLSADLRAKAEAGLAEVAELIPPNEDLFVSKYQLSQVHGCQVSMLAQLEVPFEWTIPTARGTVVHEAIALWMNWPGTPVPSLIVEEALARLEAGPDSLGDFVANLSDGDGAMLRRECTDHFAKFLEIFPPIKPQWRPSPESRLSASFASGKIILGGKVDLTLGSPTGMRAGKVILDHKTGRVQFSHRDDLLFYALIETLRLGVPPRLVATVYLDSGEIHSEEVTVPKLEAALARVIAGVNDLVAIRNGLKEPELRVGPPCRWCVISESCKEGQSYLADTDY